MYRNKYMKDTYIYCHIFIFLLNKKFLIMHGLGIAFLPFLLVLGLVYLFLESDTRDLRSSEEGSLRAKEQRLFIMEDVSVMRYMKHMKLYTIIKASHIKERFVQVKKV